jgi:DNA (cytosine-5)-methyltransferase 1
MTYATIFSGIGGWEIGLNACGWELQWQCERDEFCRAVLSARFGVPVCPDAQGLPRWLRDTFGDQCAQIDALVGSPPCPPFSIAGDRRGIGDTRHLYPAFMAAVRFLRPTYVLMEQVTGILSDGRAIREYLGGLAALGFDALWHGIPACALGAPHERDRLWIIAHAPFQRRPRALRRHAGNCPETLWPLCREFQGALDPRMGLFQAIEQRLGEPAVFSRFDGNTRRLECELAAYGNSLCPQIPYAIGQAINEIELGE